MNLEPATSSLVASLAADLRRSNARARITRNGTAHPRLLRILDYIDDHLGESEMGEEMICEAFGMSRSTVYRLFQAHGGVARYIRGCRAWLAHHHLVRDPDCRLTWLLHEVGFASERQFQRAFLAQFGMSPADWRLACRQRARGALLS